MAFATSASFARRVEAAGFELLPAGMDGDEFNALAAEYRVRLSVLPPHERRPFGFSRLWAHLQAPAKVTALRAAATAWGPDLVVYESCDLAAPVVAASLGLPRVHHGFGRLVTRACLELGAAELEPLWRAAGLAPEPLCGAFGGTYVDICPPGFQTESVPAATRVVPMRPVFPADPADTAPAWISRLADRPTVYVTLGTIVNDLAVFRVLLDALADVDCNVIATIGRDNDPAALAPLPANAVVERYVPQSFLLPHSAAVVTHGGPARPSPRSRPACPRSSCRTRPTSSRTGPGTPRSGPGAC